jgi:hypothetical protein
MAVAVSLGALGLALAAAPAQAADATGIRVAATSHCLDNNPNNPAKLQMWDCNGGSNQQWWFIADNGAFEVENVATGLCMTAPPGPDGGTVIMAGCVGAASQQWRFNTLPFPYLTIQNNPANSPGLCLWTETIANGHRPSMAGCDTTTSFNNRWTGVL